MAEGSVNEGDIRVNHEKLYDLGVRAFRVIGVPEEHARMAVDVLICSDLRGIESHGFARFAGFYINRTREGRIKTRPNVRIVDEASSAATIDGDGGLGFVASTIAMRVAIEKADVTGVGMVSVRNSTHHGPASPYALMALPHDMIGISMTTGGKGVTPPGGAARVYGLNAMSFAAPCRPPEPPFVLDMATSVVAAGKFEIYRRRGQPVPEGWAIDAEGRPITGDAGGYYQGGAILPLGGDVLRGAWKGFGLGVMVDVLTSVLSDAPSSAELGFGANHFFGALRINAFSTVDSFYDRMDTMRQTMRAAPRLPEAGPLTFPGEPEAAMEEDYRRNGIPFHPSILEGLKQMSAELGIEYELE
jgi:L-2-hydroxycarboxylate dehydrogenase (NAD+)